MTCPPDDHHLAIMAEIDAANLANLRALVASQNGRQVDARTHTAATADHLAKALALLNPTPAQPWPIANPAAVNLAMAADICMAPFENRSAA